MILEIMERRRLFSVTVEEGYPGFWEIHGSSDNDAISVSVSMVHETMTIGGNVYGPVTHIIVYGYEGNDQIELFSSDGFGYIGGSVVAGDGNDTVTVGFDGAIWGGDGNDTFNLSDSFRGEVYGSAGNDSIFVSGECIDPEIQGGDGDDYIDASGNNYGVIIRGGLGNDTILGSAYDDQIYGDGGGNLLYGGGGNDTFYTCNGEQDQIEGGDGYDMLYGDASESSVMEVEA